MDTDSRYWYRMSDPAILEVLGNFLQKTRLSQNKTQQAVSEAAGINRSTLIQIEKGSGGTLLSFIQILRALEQLHLIENFEAKKEISPLQLAEMEMKYRRRASKNPSPRSKPESTW
jgi:transcriptional regulator with XRE-family HTH domain